MATEHHAAPVVRVRRALPRRRGLLYFPVARYSSYPTVAARMERLLDAVRGSRCTAEWITGHGGMLPESVTMEQMNTAPGSCWKYGQVDFDDLMAADVVVCFTGEGGRHGGRHVELGMALMRKHLGQPVYIAVVGPRENVYYTNPLVHQFDTFEDFLANEVWRTSQMETLASPSTKWCDGRSVGVRIRRTGPAGERQTALLRRKKPPFGWALPAGHVDDHGGPDADLAARIDATAAEEVAEEIGLTTTAISAVADLGFIGNPCSRRPSADGYGHHWWIRQADVDGHDVVLAPDEATKFMWATDDDIAALIRRTVELADYAAKGGRMSLKEYADKVGMEPVWVLMYHRLGWYRLTPDEVSQIRRLTHADPYKMIG